MQYLKMNNHKEIENMSLIHQIRKFEKNQIYIMRDDLIPISFGGNKARKAVYFFNEIDKKKYNYVITYGSASSNHCRIIANLCKQRNIGCTIITTENEKETFNRDMCKIFEAEIVVCDINNVKTTIEQEIKKKNNEGFKTYFIQGGGHGNLGTQAYIDAYEEIIKFEEEKNVKLDYIFHPSGTGTTQAGLIIGNRVKKDKAKIIGISIARKSEYGKNIIANSIKEYEIEKKIKLKNIEEDINLVDDYILEGYGKFNEEIKKTVIDMLMTEGIPLDFTYTGKAFWGMKDYIKNNNIQGKNILFVHTGGTPIFFDNLKELKNEYFNIKCRNKK